MLYGKSLGEGYFPNPYIYLICVHNPFLGALKRRQLEIVRDDPDHGGVAKMCNEVKEVLWYGHDIDFKTMEDRWSSMGAEPGWSKEEFLSVEEMAMASENRTHTLFEEIEKRLDLFCSFDISTPLLKPLLMQGMIIFERASSFGLFSRCSVRSTSMGGRKCSRRRWSYYGRLWQQLVARNPITWLPLRVHGAHELRACFSNVGRRSRLRKGAKKSS